MSKPFSPQHLLVNVMPEARTELSTLLGALSLLKTELNQSSQIEMLAGAEAAAQRLLGMIQKLSDLGSLNHNQLEAQSVPVRVSKLLHRLVLLQSEKAASNGVDIEIEVDPGLASVLLDPQKLYRVIANILDQALATGRPGVLRITAAFAADGLLAITLSDTGPGETADEIFDFVPHNNSPLWKNSGAGASLQLGVYLSRQIVRLMGGDISVQAEAGVGTIWTITLPTELAVTELDPAKQFDLAREIQHVEREIALSRAQDQRLLVADDSPSNRLVLEKMLRNAGHPVDSVSDGLEVLAALKEREYAAVLLDIAMPQMDGLTACKRIRELPGAYNKIPLVALTAHTSDSDQELVYGAGFDAFLTKPTSDSLLQATVQRVIAKSTKVAVAKRPQDNRLSELNKVMGDEKLKLLLDQFSSELELRQQSLGVLQSGERVLDLPLLARTARTFGFSDLAVVAEQLLSEMMKTDTSEELKSLASVNASEDQLTTQSPAMLALIREVHSVHLLVQEYVAKNLGNSTVEQP